jgi:hypothetical protein
MEKRQLSQVFGVSRNIPLTYVERSTVDGKFRQSLAREKHLVVYGRSKQGKTCLHKHCLAPEQYIVIQCGNATNVAQLYAAILKEAGAAVTLTEKQTTTGTKKLGVEFSASGKIPLLVQGQGKARGEGERRAETSYEKKYLEIDPSDPNDMVRALDSMDFHKFIMLEDFHYLSATVQAQVAIDLKAFHEKSSTCCFIIVGVWLGPSRLVLYNGDLAGRLIPIDADAWSDEELRAVIEAGEALLNVHFPEEVKEALVLSSQGNVGILQEACYRLCAKNAIYETRDISERIGSPEEIDEIVKEIALEQAGRYQSFFRYLAEASTEDKGAMLRWLAYVLITATPEELIAGLSAETILTRIREHHPRKSLVSQQALHKTLTKVGRVQHENRVQPTILDFDANADILRIVDSGFMLYTEAVSEEELLRLIDLAPRPNKRVQPTARSLRSAPASGSG